MSVHIDELHTEVETTGTEQRPEQSHGDTRWPHADDARKERRDNRWRSLRTRSEGLDD